MKLTKDPRGFRRYEAETYSNKRGQFTRLIQESSAIGDNDDSFDKPGSSFLWVGRDHHLKREEVAELVTHLQRWLDTGSLRELDE